MKARTGRTTCLQVFAPCVLLFSTQHASAVLYTLDKTFDDPTVTDSDRFGYSVAIDGNRAVIGSRLDDTSGVNVGQAHLFDTNSGDLLQTFNDPTVSPSDVFGSSVAVSGNNVLIGAPTDSTNGSGVGQAHLFDATTGALMHTFNDPTVTTQDNFGFSVAISGNNVLVGALRDDTSGTDVGQAHLFDTTTGNLLHTFNDPTVTSTNFFGASVAINGNNVLIGDPYDNTNGTDIGQAHLFDATTGNLLQTFNDPTVTTRDQFGSSVAIEGNNVLVGAGGDDTNGNGVGQVHLFDSVSGNLLQTFDDPTVTTIDTFGSSIDISGNNVLIGAANDDTFGVGVGQAHLFDATTGNLLQTFDDPTPTSDGSFGDAFGFSVAISGNNVLIGAFGDDTNGNAVGQAHLFTSSVQTNGGLPEPSTFTLLVIAFFYMNVTRRKAS